MSEEFIFFAIMIGLICGAVYLFISKRIKPGEKWETFKPQELKVTFQNSLETKINQHGILKNGYNLFMGIHQIAPIDKVLELYGKKETVVYDEKSKYISIKEGEDYKYRFLLFRCKNKNLIYRIFGFGKSYYLLKSHDIIKGKDDKFEANQIYKINHGEKQYVFPYYMDLDTYGNVWINSDMSRFYLYDFSVKRMLENTQMYLENGPDKTIHLEDQTARHERLTRVSSDIDKSKYEEYKKSGDTTIKVIK